jgi:hypothetical protein
VLKTGCGVHRAFMASCSSLGLRWRSRLWPSTWPAIGGPSGQSWGTFLRNHMPHIAAIDLFVVPTISFNLLYVLVIIRLARRGARSRAPWGHRQSGRRWLVHGLSVRTGDSPEQYDSTCDLEVVKRGLEIRPPDWLRDAPSSPHPQ